MELPLLLAGPILRRVETTLATVWIALSEAATVRLLVKTPSAPNFHWYAVENADNGDPNNPYTDAQLSRIAQILELTSRPEYGRFALQVTGSPGQEGLGTHHMGGAAWGAHSCPDAGKRPNHTPSGARAEIVRRVMIIRQHWPPDQHF